MNLKVSYHHVDSTPALEEKIETKAQKLKKHVPGHLDVHWTCSVEKNLHSSHVKLIGDGLNMDATATDSDLYKTFDSVIDKLEKQLERKHHR